MLLEEWGQYLVKGGFMMGPLMAMAWALWYTLGYRILTLKRGSRLTVSALLVIPTPGGTDRFRGFLIEAVALAQKEAAKGNKRLRHRLEDAFFPLKEKMGNYRGVVRTLTGLAPLAGLLGTVTGMIEMFDSLGSQTFLSQTGGIAGGISQALFTTELGLIIAVPGLILGRLLDHKEDVMRSELDQIKDILASRIPEEFTHEISA